MKRIATIVLVGFCLLSVGAPAEQRVFNDKFGREIKAEIESVRPPNVSLKRADGKSFLFPIAKLSEADQKYLKQWRIENPDIKLDYRFEKEKKGAKGDRNRREEDWAFKVTVSNRGFQDLEGLQFDYTVYKQLNDRYAKDRRRLSGSLKGSETISRIERQRDAVFETKPMAIGKVDEVTKERGKGFVESTFEKWDENLVGIKLTVSYREKVVDTKEFGTVPETDEPIAEVEKATRVSRTRVDNNQ